MAQMLWSLARCAKSPAPPVRQGSRKSRGWLWVSLLVLILLGSGATWAATWDQVTPPQYEIITPSSRYYFWYIYNDGSGDYYYGYVYAPTSFKTSGPELYVGKQLHNQPQEMGGQPLQNGYYYIESVVDGYYAYYDAQEYIIYYYDADTKKTSWTLYSSTGNRTDNAKLYVTDRRYAAEAGYVYDPSVLTTDAYFGNHDVCYYFSPDSSAGVNFLAYYNNDSPYWITPTYPYYDAAVSFAILLSYWDYYKGFEDLIPDDWKTTWHNDSSNIPLSYAEFIISLDPYTCNDFFTHNLGEGLLHYAQWKYHPSGTIETTSVNAGDWGYIIVPTQINWPDYFVIYEYDLSDSSSRYQTWDSLKTLLGYPNYLPGIISYEQVDYWDPSIVCKETGVVHGYWNDGHICVNQGSGSAWANDKIDWYRTSAGYRFDDSTITNTYVLYWCVN